MLVFLKAPFFVLYFSYSTLMKFLMMLSIILLFMLMILLSNISVIKDLICGNNWDWTGAAGRGRKCLLDFNAGKTQTGLVWPF